MCHHVKFNVKKHTQTGPVSILKRKLILTAG